jgi:hypothetical protein
MKLVTWSSLTAEQQASMEMHSMTCRHHPTARYLTKHPHERSLHLTRIPSDADMASTPNVPRSDTGECCCLFEDLMVIQWEVEDPNAYAGTGLPPYTRNEHHRYAWDSDNDHGPIQEFEDEVFKAMVMASGLDRQLA